MFIKTSPDKHIASLVGQSKLQVEPRVQLQMYTSFPVERTAKFQKGVNSVSGK